LGGRQFSAIAGTFARGDKRRVVIANDSYSQPATLSLRLQNGWRFSEVLAALEAKKMIERDGTSIWKLAPGGCLLVQCMSENGEK